MNKLTSKIVTATASLALMVAVVACNKTETKTADTTNSKTNNADLSDQVVFVNSDSLLTNCEYYKELKSNMEKKSSKAEADLKDKQTAFQREVADYQKNANGMSATERQTTEQRLGRKQQELQVYQQNAGTALQNEEASEQEKLYDKVTAYLKKHAQVKGYKIVLTYSKGNPSVLFADSSLDISKEVIDGLNKAYQDEKK